MSLPGTKRSRFVRLCGGEPGIDPYTRAVSDVYQDLFDEGSFIGKGIYDVDAFEQALDGRFPENRILSHDLLEGGYARAGLLSDVQLYEEYPVALQRRRQPSAPLDSRRLADRALAAAVGPCADAARRESPENPLSAAVALEDLRQPAAQPGAGGVDGLVAARLDALVAAWLWTLAVARDPPDSSLLSCLLAALSEAERGIDQSASRRCGALGRSALRPGGLQPGVSALRGLLQPGCHRAHGRADAVHPHAASGVESVG